MKQKVKIIGLSAFFVVIMLSLFAQAESANPQETLNQYISELQKNPNDNSLREKIIKYVQTMKPAPEISEEARRHFVRGNTALKDAKDSTEYDRAIARYNDALLISPWWADPYFNMAKALELRERYDDAIASLKLYLLAAPNAEDARTAQDMIYALEEKKEGSIAKDTASKKAEEVQLLRDFSGSWRQVLADGRLTWQYKFQVSGRELTIIRIYEGKIYDGKKERVWGKGTVVDERNFEGSSTGDSDFGMYPHRFKGSLSKDGNSIQASTIVVPELAINERLRNHAQEFIQEWGQQWENLTLSREP